MHKCHFSLAWRGGGELCGRVIIFVHSTQSAIDFFLKGVGEREKNYLTCSLKFTYSAFNFAEVNIYNSWRTLAGKRYESLTLTLAVA